MYEETIQKEFARARALPLTTLEYQGSRLMLFRADQLAAGVKTAIGHCLVAAALDTGKVNSATKAIVVQGAGNTVTAVKHAIDKLRLNIRVIAVVYNETGENTRTRLRANSIEVVAMSPRSEGRTGRQNTVEALCQNPGHVFLEQHEEPLIVDIQARTFGRAILEQLATPATHFVAGVGTGGTLFGVGSALKAKDPNTELIGIEGIGSTLSLWYAYLKIRGQGFKAEQTAIQEALAAYRTAGMLTTLVCHPDRSPEEWFEISVDFPEDTSGVVGIEGLGVGNPSELIAANLPVLSRCQIVTDKEAAAGVHLLGCNGIKAATSAGANFFVAQRLAEKLASRGESGHIVTVVTSKG